MFIRWVTWKCPNCGHALERTLIKKLSLGPEFAACGSCGSTFRTRHKEWAHLTSRQRFEYFFTEDVVAILLLFPLFGIITSPVFSENSDFSWTGVIGGFLLAAVIIGLMWMLKTRSIRSSLLRCPEERDSSVAEESRLPWKRKY
jgi:hypothetical protein